MHERTHRTISSVSACLLVGLAAAALSPLEARAQNGDEGCELCHGEVEFLRQHAPTLEAARRMSVDRQRILDSAHFEHTCGDCHTGFARWPHPDTGATESCASCHEEQDEAWHGGLHAAPVTPGADTASCADCHTVHDVATVEELQQGSGMLAMNAACVSCHESSAFSPWDAHADSVSCAGCHEPHDTPGVTTEGAAVAPLLQSATCGACHEEAARAGVVDAHGVALTEEAPQTLDDLQPEGAPTCTSCHGAHSIRAVEDPGGIQALQNECASCHADYADRYYGTYHGKATVLGSEIVASCADCHAAHDIYPDSVAASSVHADRLVETCGECHEASRPAFVLYDSHPDPMDRSRNAPLFYSFVFMNTLLFGVLVVFGLHTLLWWVRILLDQRREGREAGHA